MITGFPSPAQGYEDKIIDLNSIVVKHPAATVFMKIDSTRYVRYGIYEGDLVAVDRSLKVNENSFVVYEDSFAGEFHIGWFKEIQNKIQNSMTQQIYDSAFKINVCGVVTHVLHTVRNSNS